MDIVESMPNWERKRFCLLVAKATEAYFKQPGAQERFEAWLKEDPERERRHYAQLNGTYNYEEDRSYGTENRSGDTCAG